MYKMMQKQKLSKTLQIATLTLFTANLIQAAAWADPASSGNSTNVSSGIVNNSILGNGNQQANGSGIAINGNANGSNLNANQNSNTNLLQPIVVSAPNYDSAGRGGSAALVLPRNPLPLSNAALGRSNFGMQVGVQNNPGISALTGGKENGLGWFMQAGLTIPFGKIPAVLNTPNNTQMDNMRQNRLDDQRRVFGGMSPNAGALAERRVQGQVLGLNAYNYSTVSTGKLPLKTPSNIGEVTTPQPKVLALKPAEAFSHPLNTGERIGLVEVGKEYLYLGHTRSGWVKILLPNGKEAWTSTNFEYVKFDYTEIDDLAVDPSAPSMHGKAAAAVRDSGFKKRRS
jgi:hypothetical protein